MLVSTSQLRQHARREGYAVGAFNVDTLEGVRSVSAAAEALQVPIMTKLRLFGCAGRAASSAPGNTHRRHPYPTHQGERHEPEQTHRPNHSKNAR